ncbi:hypothetical protein HAX54_025716, partial [Datura stramonium]|nr:hypothetical protein [Datura stramonium]
MRDFKKVREYERRVAEKLAEGGDGSGTNIHQEIKSYWKIERTERKEKNLPTNMLPEIYEALLEVVDRRGQKVLVGGSATSFNPTTTSLSPTMQQQPIQVQIATLPLPPPPPPPLLSPLPPLAQQLPQPPNLPYTQTLPTV